MPKIKKKNENIRGQLLLMFKNYLHNISGNLYIDLLNVNVFKDFKWTKASESELLEF